ncbi:RNA polymerase sigma factor [Phycisphaerae bacterium RAS1]|nr:RNA polymerase sigma factor [Phycisphaerae bacterium RAS1]
MSSTQSEADDASVHMPVSHEATAVLAAIRGGDPAAAEKLLPLVYDELRALAGGFFRRQRSDHTLQPTALVHEAFVRMIDATSAAWNDRAHFFAIAATAMRQILTDHARRKKAAKRGGDWDKVAVETISAPSDGENIDVVALDEALTRLGQLDARKHRVVELRFFGGLTVDEIADVLGMSKTTIESEWRAARAWLSAELSR